MGRFGFKKGDGDEDSSRLALFGSRNKSKSPAPPSSNPYATPAAPPDPYTQAKMRAGVIPSPQAPPQQAPSQQAGYGNDFRGSGQPYGNDEKRAGPQNGYGANKFGNDRGYGGGGAGGNPYAGFNQTSGTSRHGGYGGLGAANVYDSGVPDENRDALFGGARERVQQQKQAGPPDYQYNPATEPEESRSYGAYGDRQLTAEEEEEEDIQATKQEIRFMKQQDVSSTRNALAMAAQAEETGRNTLARLGAQGERLHNTKKNLDLAANQITAAEDKTSELKRLNRSMFVPANNPFTSKSRAEKREQEIMDRHQSEREQREATRNQAYRANQRMNESFKEIDRAGHGQSAGTFKSNLAERGKYQFEADSEDEGMEDEIDQNLEQLHGAAQRMNKISRALGSEIESQNKIIDGIGMQSDAVDDRVVMQTARLKRIK